MVFCLPKFQMYSSSRTNLIKVSIQFLSIGWQGEKINMVLTVIIFFVDNEMCLPDI